MIRAGNYWCTSCEDDQIFHKIFKLFRLRKSYSHPFIFHLILNPYICVLYLPELQWWTTLSATRVSRGRIPGTNAPTIRNLFPPFLFNWDFPFSMPSFSRWDSSETCWCPWSLSGIRRCTRSPTSSSSTWPCPTSWCACLPCRLLRCNPSQEDGCSATSSARCSPSRRVYRFTSPPSRWRLLQ